jgi:hypothetical protein
MGYLRLVSSIALSALLLSAETDYRFAFPQSEILMGVDIKWLMKSPFGDQMKSGVKANLGELKPLEDFLENIDGVYVSAVSKPAVIKAGANKPAGSDVLLLFKGRFELDKLVALGLKNGFKLDQWGNTKVLLQPLAKKPARTPANSPATLRKANYVNTQFSLDAAKAQRPFFALYDAKTIIVGEEGPLRVALERMEGGITPQANPLLDRARNLEAANDFWIVGSMAPLNLESALSATPGKGGKSAANDPFASLAKEIRNFSIGVAVRRDVALDLQLQASSPKVATQMQDMMKGLLAMQKATAKPEEALPFDLDKALQVSASGSIFRASLTIEQKELEQIMASGVMGMMNGTIPMSPKNGAKQKAPVESAKVESANATPMPADSVAVAPVPVPVPVPVAAKPAAPARKTVMIYGLPGGPKEVPVTNP